MSPATEAGSDPFVTFGAVPQIAVRSAGDGFRIEVSSAINPQAHDILAHAQALQALPKAAANQQAKLGAL